MRACARVCVDTPPCRFVEINLPLQTSAGLPLFDLSDPSSLRGETVFVQFVVSLVDSSGTPAATTLSASLPVAQGGVNTWCLAQATGDYSALDYVDGVDLIVGSAGTAADLSALQTAALPLSAVGPPNMTASPASRSAPAPVIGGPSRIRAPTPAGSAAPEPAAALAACACARAPGSTRSIGSCAWPPRACVGAPGRLAQGR